MKLKFHLASVDVFLFFFNCFNVFFFLLFCEKQTNETTHSTVVWIRDLAALQTDQAFRLCAFLTTRREAMDWFVSLGQLFKNIPCWDGGWDSAEALALQMVRAALI